MICIYCPNTDPKFFCGEEHVIPQGFGTFGSRATTPTLKCVCDECNSYFGKHLDQTLARDTLEGVTRYKKGLRSGETRRQNGMRFTLAPDEKVGSWAGIIIAGVDGRVSKLLGPIPQALFLNFSTQKHEAIPLEKIHELDLKKLNYSDKDIRIFASSQEDHDRVVIEVKKLLPKFQIKEHLPLPPFLQDKNQENTELTVTVEGVVDEQRKRALAKILFNFAAFYLGQDEVLKAEWDKARSFIRSNGDALLARASQKPFWDGQETDKMRFEDNSYNLRLENQNDHLVGVIQFFNLFTYEFILVENYQINPDKEIAYRFTPNQPPQIGKKMARPEWIEIQNPPIE